mmetsp:Transcript_30887/g.35170  ORF Transcript_30887/g.35170 Transcript_30887/m.35170 type:complete len:187 (-) Transcript_30887:225-785(-)|eukprot:CAMPEP_0114982732 /NCGR_PEP_ID=MMETSP0216-20121206/6295_1 /TAXON_ID=223996 /ORGANISM="Protocruzia adherens, Strain Boccale" /LENGTH=186 /DNA_ID=CAMNT_0002344611 /DNA_START=74 /DNA_END=634 /DNA_ORIENTATION=-
MADMILSRSPQVYILGQIKGAHGFESTHLYAKWRIVAGESWRLVSGKEKDSGETYEDHPEAFSSYTAFEHPIDLHYATKSIRGWPKLLIEVWEVDSHGRNSIGGYGMLSIPMGAGSYDLEIPTWRPKGSTTEQWASYFLGARPELQYQDVLVCSSERFGFQTYACGKVQVQFQIIQKDFNLHGISA